MSITNRIRTAAITISAAALLVVATAPRIRIG
jgi:hypothetical protein